MALPYFALNSTSSNEQTVKNKHVDLKKKLSEKSFERMSQDYGWAQ